MNYTVLLIFLAIFTAFFPLIMFLNDMKKRSDSVCNYDNHHRGFRYGILYGVMNTLVWAAVIFPSIGG